MALPEVVLKDNICYLMVALTDVSGRRVIVMISDLVVFLSACVAVRTDVV